ncbi:hypothetical protein ACJJID_00150 (plasmid) [Microbulbifer sp. CnH-101-G]|uniref:hypothetical protein n=1 Tax=Microbulbifer sp. CnH-101-G TaxID=3243393 RepID=UPI004039C961
MILQPSRFPKLLALAKGRDCVRCGNNEGSTVAAHYQGYRSHSYSKGRGIKPHDAMTAFLCYQCHSIADSSVFANSPEAHSREFLLLIIATQMHLLLEGRTIARGLAPVFTTKLMLNASDLPDCSETELHETACRLAQLWDSKEITIAPAGAMVSSFVGVSQ